MATCKTCRGFGLVECDDSDPKRIGRSGPGTPAWKFCTCPEGAIAKKQYESKPKRKPARPPRTGSHG